MTVRVGACGVRFALHHTPSGWWFVLGRGTGGYQSSGLTWRELRAAWAMVNK